MAMPARMPVARLVFGLVGPLKCQKPERPSHGSQEKSPVWKAEKCLAEEE